MDKNTFLNTANEILKNKMDANRIHLIEITLNTLKNECTANEGSHLDNAYNVVFQDLMTKLLELKNKDL